MLSTSLPRAGRGRRRLLAAGALSAAAAATAVTALAPPVALAVPAVAREIDVPGKPGQLTLGPDGNVWVVLDSATADLASIAPDGTVTPYRDARLSFATGIASGPDGRLWITRSGEIVHFSPSDPTGTDTAIAVATLGDPRRIASDGRALWTASGDQLYKVEVGGTVTPTRVDGMAARGTTVGADGRVWIADFGGQRLVSVDSASPLTPVFHATGGGPQEVAAGAAGQVAYTNQGIVPHEVGLVTPPAALTRVAVPGTDPFGITRGLDEAYWVANFASHDLTRLAPDGTVTRLSGLSPLSGPRWIAGGAGGTLWVSLELSRRVALVSGLEVPRAPEPPRTDPPRADPPRTDPPRSDPQRSTPDTTKPVLTGIALAGSAPKAGARGLRIALTLSEPATVTASLQRPAAGKRSGGRCVKPTRKLRRARACTRWIALGSARATAGAGATTLTVRARRGRLTAGRYRIVLNARDEAGNRGASRTLRVTLKRR